MPKLNLRKSLCAGRRLLVVATDPDGAPAPVVVLTRPSMSSSARYRAIMVSEVAPGAVAVLADLRLEMN